MLDDLLEGIEFVAVLEPMTVEPHPVWIDAAVRDDQLSRDGEMGSLWRELLSRPARRVIVSAPAEASLLRATPGQAELLRFEDVPALTRFREAFPDARPVLGVSNVVFSAARDRAVAMGSFYCGLMCWELYGYVLEEDDGDWRITSKVLLVQS